MKNIGEGLASLEKSFAINPNCAENYALKGILLQLRSKVAAGESSRQALEKEAEDSLAKALQINGNLKTLLSSFIGE